MIKIKNKPLLSVVMPVYNTANFLQEAIESILVSDFKDFEFIIVDDKSSDNSKEIIKKFAQIDSRIIFLENDINLGIGATRNIGIKKSTTDYIVNFDSDDIASPNLLSKLYNTIISREVDIVGVNLYFMDKNSRNLGKKYKFPENDIDIKKPLSLVCSMSNTGVIINKKCFQEACFYNEKDRYTEDYNIWLKFSEKGYIFYNIPEYLVNYRIHETNSIIVDSRGIVKETLLDFKNKFKNLLPLNKNTIFFIFGSIFSYLRVFLLIKRNNFINHKNN